MLRWRARGRRLYAADGRFEVGNLQDWQHSAMYAAFLLSGIVDMLGWGLPEHSLPDGVEHVGDLWHAMASQTGLHACFKGVHARTLSRVCQEGRRSVLDQSGTAMYSGTVSPAVSYRVVRLGHTCAAQSC